MKTEKWYEKAIAMFDEESTNGAIAANMEDGFIFANSAGTYALFIPGYSAASAMWEVNDMARKSKTLRVLHDQAMQAGELATSEITGSFADRKCKVRQLSNGKSEVYVYEKLLRMFPKNALYYISSPIAPVIVGIWENDRFHEIGLVMPMYSAEFFRADK